MLSVWTEFNCDKDTNAAIAAGSSRRQGDTRLSVAGMTASTDEGDVAGSDVSKAPPYKVRVCVGVCQYRVVVPVQEL